MALLQSKVKDSGSPLRVSSIPWPLAVDSIRLN